MSKTEFYKGWTILIFDTGIGPRAVRMMIALKGGAQIDFTGDVVNDDYALRYARQYIDELERSGAQGRAL